MTEEYLDEHFYPNFHYLNEESILQLNAANTDPRVNNVITGMHRHCYGLHMVDDTDSIQYNIFYINGRRILEGCLLELDIKNPERDRLLIAFSMYIADAYDLDVLETFNTFQESIRSMCEQVGYLTITVNELLPYKGMNPHIIAKDVKGIFIIPFLEHAHLYRYLFGNLEIITPTKGDSFVYLMHNKRNNLVKIGKSINPQHREKTLQAEEPEITMVAVWKASDKLERYLHKLYKHKRLRGEWFKLTFKELKEIRGHVYEFINQVPG